MIERVGTTKKKKKIQYANNRIYRSIQRIEMERTNKRRSEQLKS